MSPPTATATESRSSVDGIAGWSGMIFPYGMHSPVGDPRVLHPSTYELSRMLPIPVTFQERRQPNHAGAIQGLATITRVWQTDAGLFGSGTFDLDDPRACQVARKIERGFLGWGSADIETDGGQFEKLADGRRVPSYRMWRLMGYTLVPDSAFAGSRIHTVRDPSQITSVDQLRANQRTQTFSAADDATFTERLTFSAASRVHRFTVTGDVNLPWADRGRQWDEQAASDRVWAWADGDTERLARAHLYRNPEADPETKAAYKLGFADIIDGELTAVFRAVSSAAGYLGQSDIPAGERDQIESRINTLYGRAAAAFGDPTVRERRENMAVIDESIEIPGDDSPDIESESGDRDLSDADVQRIVDALTPVIETTVRTVLESVGQAEQMEAERMSAVRSTLATLRNTLDG